MIGAADPALPCRAFIFRPAGWRVGSASILAILLSFLAAMPAHADDRTQALALVKRASNASRLSDIGFPYTVKFNFRVPGEHGTEGTYQFWSFQQSRWRKEIHARGFNTVEVGEPDRRWEKMDLDYTPEPIETMSRLVSNGTAFDWPVDDDKVKVRSERDGECVVIKNQNKYETHICFDRATSLLRAVYDNAGSRYEFSDYQTFEGRKVPSKMNAYQWKILVVEAKLLFLTRTAADLTLVTPPPDAEAWDWCPNMEPPKLIRATRPQGYRGAWGANRFWVVVGADGRVEEGGLMTSAGVLLDRSAANALKDWLFRPAMCNGLPIRVKTTAGFTFEY